MKSSYSKQAFCFHSSSCLCKCWSSWLWELALLLRCLSVPWQPVNKTSHLNFTQGLRLVTGCHIVEQWPFQLASRHDPHCGSLAFLFSKIGCTNIPYSQLQCCDFTHSTNSLPGRLPCIWKQTKAKFECATPIKRRKISLYSADSTVWK